MANGLIYITLSLYLGLTCQAAMAIQHQVKVLGHQREPVAGVVVYMEALTQQSSAAAKASMISQQNKAFTPLIQVVQLGSKLTFTNQDDITHHIYSVSQTQRFSFKLKPGAKKQLAVQQIGEITMGCNIHDWMNGYLLIVDTPYFAFINNEGIATFNLVVDGAYRTTVWYPGLKQPPHKISRLINTQLTMLRLKQPLTSLPRQQDIQEFDFLEGYE